MNKGQETLGYAAEYGMLLRVECMHCRHVGHHKAVEIAKLRRRTSPVAALRFTCSRCKRRDARVEAVEIHRDRLPKVDVWVPMRLKR